jgi:hypothetical protein
MRERTVNEYRQQIEKRYPLTCADCAEMVRKRIKSTDYGVKTYYLGKSLERSRKMPVVERLPRMTWSAGLRWLSIAALDWLSRVWMFYVCWQGQSPLDHGQEIAVRFVVPNTMLDCVRNRAWYPLMMETILLYVFWIVLYPLKWILPPADLWGIWTLGVDEDGFYTSITKQNMTYLFVGLSACCVGWDPTWWRRARLRLRPYPKSLWPYRASNTPHI